MIVLVTAVGRLNIEPKNVSRTSFCNRQKGERQRERERGSENESEQERPRESERVPLAQAPSAVPANL